MQERSSTSTLKTFIPILTWLPKYNKTWLRGDILAAITVWALVVPEAMAYAGIAGMPPETGLYAAPFALLGYAIFGTSRQLNVGPSSTVAALSFTIISGVAIAGSDNFISLSITLAILTGILLIIAGLLKLGVFADFLSKPVLGGFVIGLAISIAVGQLDKLLGYHVESINFVPDILLILQDIGQTHTPTLLVGLVSLGSLFFIDKFIPKLPGAITVVILSIVLSAIFNFEALGIHIVGEIPAGLPPIGLPSGISLGIILDLIPGAVAIALVGFAESVAAARSYATKYRYEINANQEMIALGIASLGAGISQGFVVDGSLSKSAAADEAGAKSQMVSLIVAAMVLITVVALTPLFRTLPEATLGAIVIHAVWHLINIGKLKRYYHIRKIDFWAAMAAMFGVLGLGILAGLILAVTISLLALLIKTKQARTAILGKIPNQNVYRNIENYPDAETYPGLIIFRFDEQLFFANATNFRDAVLTAVAATPSVRLVLVDAESINEIDITGLDMLSDLRNELVHDNIELRFAEMKAHILEYVRRTDLETNIGAEHFYQSVQDGVEAYLAEQTQSSEIMEDK